LVVTAALIGALVASGRDWPRIVLLLGLVVVLAVLGVRGVSRKSGAMWTGLTSILIAGLALIITVEPYGSYLRSTVGGCGPPGASGLCGSYGAVPAKCPSILKRLPPSTPTAGLQDTSVCLASRLVRRVLLVPEAAGLVLGVALTVFRRRQRPVVRATAPG
jgi:hypothetical protein